VTSNSLQVSIIIPCIMQAKKLRRSIHNLIILPDFDKLSL